MRSLSRRTQRQKPKKLQIWKVSGPKEAGALLPREKSVIALCVGLQEARRSDNTKSGAPGSKSPRNVKKFQKLRFELDKYAESDKVRSQSAHETNQRGVNQV
jgi:hypothetical protein